MRAPTPLRPVVGEETDRNHTMILESSIVRVGILEDDPQVRKIVIRFLQANHFVVERMRDGAQALSAVADHSIDLLLLDLGLPGEDGIDILTRLRGASRLPVLIISGRSETFAIARGLDAGADDYITKPIAFEELGARLRSVLRRASATARPDKQHVGPLHFGPVQIDIEHRKIMSQDGVTTLTAREAQLLALLLHADGKPVSRAALTRATVGLAWEISLRSLDVHVSNIRRKLSEAGVTGDPIQTVRNVGYRLMSAGHSDDG